MYISGKQEKAVNTRSHIIQWNFSKGKAICERFPYQRGIVIEIGCPLLGGHPFLRGSSIYCNSYHDLPAHRLRNHVVMLRSHSKLSAKCNHDS